MSRPHLRFGLPVAVALGLAAAVLGQSNAQTPPPEPFVFQGVDAGGGFVGWSADGRHLALGTRWLTLLDSETLAPRAALGRRWPAWPGAWSPSGRFLSVVGPDNRLWIVHAASARTHAALPIASPRRVEWSPAGHSVAVNSGLRVSVWSLPEGEERARLPAALIPRRHPLPDGRMQPVRNFDWHPAGDRLATVTEEAVTVWDLDGNDLARMTLPPPAGEDPPLLEGVAWDPRGELLAGWIGEEVLLWNAADGSIQATLPAGPGAPRGGSVVSPSTDPLWGVFWRPDGEALAVFAIDRRLGLWSRNGEPLARLEEVDEASWHPAGTWLTVRRQSVLELRDPADAELVRSLLQPGHVEGLQHRGRYFHLWSRVGDAVLLYRTAAGVPPALVVWEARTGEVRLSQGRDGPGSANFQGGVGHARWRPDGRQVAVQISGGYTYRLFDVATGEELAQALPRAAPPRGVEWLPGREVFVTAARGPERVREGVTGAPLADLPASLVRGAVFAWSPDGRFLAGGSPVGIWDLARSEHQQALSPDLIGAAYAFQWSPAGEVLAVLRRSGPPLLWDVEEGRPRAELQDPPEGGFTLVWSPDGARLAGVGMSRTRPAPAVIWDAATGERLHSMDLGARFARWSHDGRFLVTAAQGGPVHVWEVGPGRLRATFEEHRAAWWNPRRNFLLLADTNRSRLAVWDVDRGLRAQWSGVRSSDAGDWWSPDGRHLAIRPNTTTLGSFRVARADGTLLATVREQTLPDRLVWSADGERLASIARGRGIVVWQAATGERVAQLEESHSATEELLWHPDGRRLVAPCEDGALRYWDAASGRLLGALYARDGDWLAVTPEGTFAAGGEGARWLQYRVGEQLFPADRFRERFENPERVREALTGGGGRELRSGPAERGR